MTNKINGIDVSESVLTATNNDVYYSQKAVDELQNNIKRLQEENEKLKNKNNNLIEEIASENIDIAILQKENEELKKPCLVMPKVKQLAVPIEKYEKLYKALEEINILAKNYCNACDEFKAKTYKNKNDCLYCNYGFIKRKTNEALNDRD